MDFAILAFRFGSSSAYIWSWFNKRHDWKLHMSVNRVLTLLTFSVKHYSEISLDSDELVDERTNEQSQCLHLQQPFTSPNVTFLQVTSEAFSAMTRENQCLNSPHTYTVVVTCEVFDGMSRESVISNENGLDKTTQLVPRIFLLTIFLYHAKGGTVLRQFWKRVSSLSKLASRCQYDH